MALIPGTLPNDTCYGTPQDLLELFAQYLDVPAFALSSKVVFSTTNTGFTSDIVWFDTTSATRPIMKITVSSSGFLDYVKNYITAAPVVTIVGADSVLILDASDSGNTKRGLVSDIVPAAGSITPAQLSQPFTSGTVIPTTSGTAFDITGIPSWVKTVSVLFKGVTVTPSSILVQLGTSSAIATTGYSSISNVTDQANGTASTFVVTNGMVIFNNSVAVRTYDGIMTLSCIDSATNSWVNSHALSMTTQVCAYGGGGVSLASALTRIRITTVSSNTFSAGSLNILYEG